MQGVSMETDACAETRVKPAGAIEFVDRGSLHTASLRGVDLNRMKRRLLLSKTFACGNVLSVLSQAIHGNPIYKF